MKFFKKELCEKLQKIGCVSESGFYYNFYDGDECANPVYCTANPREISAFSIYDFLSDEEYVEENLKKIFKNTFNSAFWSIKTPKQFLVMDDNQEAFLEETVNMMLKENNNG